MALLSCAVYDTEDNKRTWMTDATLKSLNRTVDWTRHRLFVVDNASCQATQELYETAQRDILHRVYPPFELLKNSTNVGTAKAVNRGWARRRPGEALGKLDNDVNIHQAGWADEIEEVFRRESMIGMVGLKRKDLEESPTNKNPWYKSTLHMTAHKPGERWMIVELVGHVMGTVHVFRSELFDKIGYLCQPSEYGFDDSLASWRAHLAGFDTAFLPHIEIDHLDPGDTPFQKWKQDHSGAQMARYNEIKELMRTGKMSIYHDDPDAAL